MYLGWLVKQAFNACPGWIKSSGFLPIYPLKSINSDFNHIQFIQRIILLFRKYQLEYIKVRIGFQSLFCINTAPNGIFVTRFVSILFFRIVLYISKFIMALTLFSFQQNPRKHPQTIIQSQPFPTFCNIHLILFPCF